MKQGWRFPAQEEPAPQRARRRARRRLSFSVVWRFCVRETCSALAKVMSLVVYGALLFVMVVDGEEIWIPALKGKFETAAANAPGAAPAPEISVGGIGVSMGDLSLGGGAAGVTLSDVEVSQGEMVVHLPKVTTSLGVAAGLKGQLRPRAVRVEGGALRFRRDADGRFLISAGADAERFVPLLGGGAAAAFDLAGMLGAIEAVGSRAMLADLDSVALEGVEIGLADVRSGKAWETRDAEAALEREGELIRASVRAEFSGGAAGLMKVAARMQAPAAGAGPVRVQLELENVRPADLASQFRALDWMTLIDAPASGNLALEFDGAGALAAMSGTLTLGAGAIAPGDDARIGFDGAKGYFRYDPLRDQFAVDGLEVATSFGAVSADGTVYLTRGKTGAVDILTSQMKVHHLSARPPHLAQPVRFGSGEVTGRVFVDPFRIEIGAARFAGALADLAVSGRVRLGAEGWDVALDANVAEIAQGDVMALWPETLRPGVRRWLDRNIRAGQMRDVAAHIRTEEGRPRFAVGFDFAGAEVSILDTLPPVTNGAGRIDIARNRLDLLLTAGETDAGSASPGAPRIDLSGTRFTIADMSRKPVIARADLEGEGEIGAFLALLDHRPLNVLKRIGLAADIADGRAHVATELELPLLERLRIADVSYAAVAELRAVRSDAVVPKRRVEAEQLALAVTPEALKVTGPIRLNGVPMRIAYDRALVDNPGGEAQVTGEMAVSATALAGLGINLPEGSLAGRGSATFALDLAAGLAPLYQAAADLSEARLNIPALGWRKGAGRRAEVTLSGRLGDAPTVQALAFRGPDLRAEGALSLGPSGLREARFDKIEVGRWLNGALRWAPGQGRDEVEISGGALDLRFLPERGGKAKTGSGGPKMRLALTPDTVTVTDTIRLTRFSGRLTSDDGGRGRFSARVNGGAEVTGVVRDGGTVYLQARDGGQALADAGILRNISGGTLRVSLTPLAKGIYDGRFSLQNARAINAPLLANLLAVSNLFGLLDRLAGAGIGFDDAQGWFVLSKDQLTITRARAVGPSLGVTLAGSYDLGRDALDMEGVVSPLYLLNGLPARIPVLGQLLGGRRDGEGLLGATFRLTGRAGQPTTSVNPLSLLTPGAAREIFMTRPAVRPGSAVSE
ncbi:MAG: AsmA-like C-terminal domain-containing protein [Pseudomonadota bacterium]